MADDLKMARAREIYNMLCAAIERREWEFTKEENALLVHFVVNGEDIPIQMALFVESEKELVTVLSPLPFRMSRGKRMEGAVAACVASYGMADGSFDYDMEEGGIVFRLVASYRDSTLSEGVLQYMISCSCATVDQYNHRFHALEEGKISIADFVKME